jgi:CheY-like chemotaxis protein
MDNARRQGRDMVLIADSNVERAQRLARACVDRGIDVEVATHGAQALEVALSSRPVAMVAQLGLPLIDGERLAEILHANPRSETLGVLYVADDDAELRDGSGQARVVPGHADPEMLVHFLEAMVHRRQDPPGEVEDEAGGIEGELAQLSLTELIDLFHVNRKNGRIALEHASGPRGEAGQVVLREGDVIDASTGVVRGEKALYRLLGWGRGHFRFHPDTGPYEATIERPTRALLREGRRQLDEWKRLVVDLPPEHARVGLRLSRASLPNVLHPLSQEVLLVLEMTDRVQEVIDRCAYPDYQVLRTLITMVRRGLLEVRHEAPSTDALSGAGFSPAFGPQLRERIQRIGRPASGRRCWWCLRTKPRSRASAAGWRGFPAPRWRWPSRRCRRWGRWASWAWTVRSASNGSRPRRAIASKPSGRSRSTARSRWCSSTRARCPTRSADSSTPTSAVPVRRADGPRGAAGRRGSLGAGHGRAAQPHPGVIPAPPR